LVEEAKWYHLDIFRVSLIKRYGPGNVNLEERWKLFYSGVDQSRGGQ